jgi:hypothetical protein
LTKTEQLLAKLDELAAVEERATKRRRARASWPEMVGSSTRNASLIALVRALVSLHGTIYRHGEWDDGCFYYSGKSASELEGPISETDAAIAAFLAGGGR